MLTHATPSSLRKPACLLSQSLVRHKLKAHRGPGRARFCLLALRQRSNKCNHPPFERKSGRRCMPTYRLALLCSLAAMTVAFAADDMVRLAGGTFTMGSDRG